MDELAPAEVEEEEREEADGGGEEEEEKEGEEVKGELPSLDEDPEGSDCVEKKEKKRTNVRGKRRRRKRGELPRRRMFVQVADIPQSDLLHHFQSCCQFIKEGRERGTVLVHW